MMSNTSKSFSTTLSALHILCLCMYVYIRKQDNTWSINTPLFRGKLRTPRSRSKNFNDQLESCTWHKRSRAPEAEAIKPERTLERVPASPKIYTNATSEERDRENPLAFRCFELDEAHPSWVSRSETQSKHLRIHV